MVLSQDGHENAVYELGGDEGFTLEELAAEVQAQSGQPVRYQNLPEADYATTLKGFGLPDAMADKLADADIKLERGELYTDNRDLSRLIGRPTTTLSAGGKAALQD